jgi:hypothetical protein
MSETSRTGWRLVVGQFLQHAWILAVAGVAAIGTAVFDAVSKAGIDYITSGAFITDGLTLNFTGLKNAAIAAAFMGIFGLWQDRRRRWAARPPTVAIGTTAGGEVKIDASPAAPAQVVTVEAPPQEPHP